MRMKPVQIAIIAAAGLAAAGAAHADALSWNPNWAFSGFGTLAYTKTSTDEGQFVNAGQWGGVTKKGGIGTDSLLGAQVNAQANNVFSATVQGLVERNGKGSYQPQVEWAFLKAQVTPDWSVRAGRMGTPFFMVSDYRHVNYSNVWVRPPVDVYYQVPISNFDGGDLTYHTNFGDTAFTVQVFDGKTTAWVTGIKATIRNQMGVNVSAEFDYGITVRAGTAKGKLTFENPQLTQLATVLSQTPFAAVGTELTGKDVSFSGVGISIDHGDFVGNAEYTLRRTNNFVADTTGWEVTGGYRLGKFTPFAMVSKVRIDSTNVNNNIPALTPQLAALHAAVNSVLFSPSLDQHTSSVGVRWDVHKNIALKAQYDRVHVTSGDAGAFEKATANLSKGGVNVFALSCDFVF